MSDDIMGSDSSSEEDFEYGTSYTANAMNRLLERLRPFFSKSAFTAYLGTFLFFMTAIGMIFVSIVAYAIFYYNFIPQVGLERVVHLQFGDGNPWGTAALDSALISSQAYDVHVVLELPRTPSNLAAGNFMLDLSLLPHPLKSARTGENTVAPISHSRRSAILTYASPLIDISTKVSFLPLYVLGWRREAEHLVVPMMERVEFASGANNRPQSLRLELHSQSDMQVYTAKVTFRASFSGLRWVMYQWRVPSFFVFSFMFWSVSMLSFSVSWILISCVFIKPEIKEEEEEEDEIKAEDEEESEATVKKELLEESDLEDVEPYASSSSEALRLKREIESDSEDESNQDPIMTPKTEALESSGSGTATENAEASGIQRRRSRLFKEEHS
ncbi:putative adipose-regulatory protein-domain-containing protein [Aspergillus egyptiacus]|nr:putative adipose-regulatory protein-domain-containing protein [Aspergillus egyptiacus]